MHLRNKKEDFSLFEK